MSKRNKTVSAQRDTTQEGLHSLLQSIESGLNSNDLDPRFVDRLIRKIEQEFHHKHLPAWGESDSELMTQKIKALSSRVIEKKASGLTEAMAHLRSDDSKSA